MRPSKRVLVVSLAFAALVVSSVARAQDWPMYGRDLKHSFTNPGSLINAGNVGLLPSSAAVVDGKVYFAGGKTMYCLKAADGSLVWKKVICGNPEAPSCESDEADPTRIFSSPAVFQGNVYIGHTPDGANGYRGGIGALDAA